MKRLIHFVVCRLLFFCLFLSCKKDNKSVLTSSTRDTFFDPDFKLDTLFSFSATPPLVPFTSQLSYIKQQTFYLPVLLHINTRNLRVRASYDNHPYMDLPASGSRYIFGGDYITVFIEIREFKRVEVFVRITT